MINKIGQTQYKPQTPDNKNKSGLNYKQKAIIGASSVAGIAPVFAVLAKRKGFSLNPAKIIKTPIKDMAIFKYSPKNKVIDFGNPKAIIATAIGSVAGGFIGGTIVDKQNIKAKKREILSQLLGNVLVPVSTVYLGSVLFNKHQDSIENAMPQIKSASKTVGKINTFMRKLPQIGATITLLGIGIYLGNKVSNYINEKLYNKKVERNIKATDFAPHLDDLCIAATVMNPKSSFGQKLGRIIPFALIVPGYQTGIAQDS